MFFTVLKSSNLPQLSFDSWLTFLLKLALYEWFPDARKQQCRSTCVEQKQQSAEMTHHPLTSHPQTAWPSVVMMGTVQNTKSIVQLYFGQSNRVRYGWEQLIRNWAAMEDTTGVEWCTLSESIKYSLLLYRKLSLPSIYTYLFMVYLSTLSHQCSQW